MSTAAKLIGYVAILAVALIGAFGIGTAVGPIGQGGGQDPAHERVQDEPRDSPEDQDQPRQQDDEHKETSDEHAE